MIMVLDKIFRRKRSDSLWVSWRKPVSQVCVLCLVGLLLFSTSRSTPVGVLVTEILGMLLVIVAALGRIWCALYIAGRKNAELCRDGAYSVCRNPLYGFSFLGAMGFALVARSVPVALILIPIFWGYHHFVIKFEETRLRSLFGETYDDYCAKTSRLWPRFNRYWSRPNLTIDPRMFMRALLEVAWFLIAFAAFEVIEHLRGASLGEATLPTFFAWPF